MKAPDKPPLLGIIVIAVIGSQTNKFNVILLNYFEPVCIVARYEWYPPV